MSRAQVIRPAGAGHETLYVLLAAMLIAALAATVVGLRGERVDEQRIASHQIDARRDLNAAEQGVYTDLHVAYDEIVALREDNGQAPAVQTLADEALPPFIDDTSSASRGAHRWQWLDSGAYLGLSQDSDVAGSFLLVLPQAADSQAQVWLRRDRSSLAPDDLGQAALVAAGWQEIVSHYDAGVTREHRH